MGNVKKIILIEDYAKGIDSKKVYFILSAHGFDKVINEPHLLMFTSSNQSSSNGLLINQTDMDEFDGVGLWSWDLENQFFFGSLVLEFRKPIFSGFRF